MRKLEKKQYKDREWLYTKFISDGLSQTEIGKLCECSHGTIYNYLKKFDLCLKQVGKYNRTDEIKHKNSEKHLGKTYSESVNLSKGRKGHKSYINQVKKAKEIMTGENHHNWKGGVSSPRRMLVKRAEYKQFRSKMFERDNFRCQICGKRGCNLHLHHKIHQSVDETKIMDANNVETLCIPCHITMHPNINCMKGWSL